MMTVEFDSGGRTYRIQSPSIQRWNVHSIALLSDKMTTETDLRTGEKIFVTWGGIAVIRLASTVDSDGRTMR